MEGNKPQLQLLSIITHIIIFLLYYLTTPVALELSRSMLY